MLKLRKIKESDLYKRVEWMNNSIVYENMHFDPPITLQNTMKWYEKNQKCTNRIDVVFEEENGLVISMGGLTNIDYTVRKAEFYVFVNPEMHRQGYGRISSYLLCKYGFQILQLHKIYLYTNSSNLAARHTYESIGFTLEGRLRDEMICNEQYADRLYYGILASELEKDFYPLVITG